MSTTTNPVRLLYCCSTLERGGPVAQLYAIVRHLDTTAFVPSILTLSLEPEDSMASEFDRLGIPRFSLGLGRATSVVLGPLGIANYLASNPVDVVHSFGIRADLFAAVCLRRVALLSTRHEPFFQHKVIKHGPLVGTAIELVHSGAMACMDRVVCVSRATTRTSFLGRLMRSTTIQNGIDVERVHPPTSQAKAELKRSLGIEVDRVVFAVVGSLEARKDPLTIIKAFRTAAGCDEAFLLFIGDGPLRCVCEERAGDMDNVSFTGFVGNVDRYLGAADVFVLAAHSEGLPMAVLEGLAAGLPVLLSRIPPCEEILEVEPNAGFLFDVKDVDHLSRLMDHMIHERREAMQVAARLIVEKRFNSLHMSRCYQHQYRTLVRTRSERGVREMRQS